MTRADRELLQSLHAKIDFLIARGGPQVDRFDQALIDALHAASTPTNSPDAMSSNELRSPRRFRGHCLTLTWTRPPRSMRPATGSGMDFVVSGAAVSRSACTFRTTTADGSSCPRT